MVAVATTLPPALATRTVQLSFAIRFCNVSVAFSATD